MVGPEREKFIKGILTNPNSCPLFKILVSHSVSFNKSWSKTGHMKSYNTTMFVYEALLNYGGSLRVHH
jgi:hypothetical protein